MIDEHNDIRSLPNAPKDRGHLSGMLDPDEMIIWIDAAEARRSPQRKRFTIGHEIGHLRMHTPGASRVFADGADDICELPRNGIATSTLTLPPLRQREREADAFARELLMPKMLVTEHARRSGFNLPALAERFDVSVPAVRMRLRLLGVLPKYMA
ncbi:MAG TPA: ImmA/IrrE family metallo-endopeptidase [Polyangiaceae bacterium]|nr:ImmA/IrrE family metallo-endopeptidase [Polyangiaceae bacterium]